jgi:hypothetical protein
MPSLRRLAAALLVLLLQAACAGVRPPAEPAPPPPEPAPAPAGHELSSPIENGEADTLEEEALEALRETEALLEGLDDATRRTREESIATVRGLVEQSRAALAEGDLQRAHNLARKARELAAEL